MMFLTSKIYNKQQIFKPNKIHIIIADKRTVYLKAKTLTYIAMKVLHILVVRTFCLQ